MRELEKVLDANEKVLWEGKPVFWPFLLNGILPTFLFGVLWTAFTGTFFFLASSSKTADAEAFGMIGLFVLIGIAMIVIPLFYFPLVYKKTFYAITDKRVLLQRGIVGRDFVSIDFDRISHSNVNVSLYDVICRQQTGTINILTAAGGETTTRRGLPVPYRLLSVSAPYDVIKFLKKVSFDVKADIHYPNAMRPSQNPGYQTNYDPNKE